MPLWNQVLLRGPFARLSSLPRTPASHYNCTGKGISHKTCLCRLLDVNQSVVQLNSPLLCVPLSSQTRVLVNRLSLQDFPGRCGMGQAYLEVVVSIVFGVIMLLIGILGLLQNRARRRRSGTYTPKDTQ